MSFYKVCVTKNISTLGLLELNRATLMIDHRKDVKYIHTYLHLYSTNVTWVEGDVEGGHV